MKYDNHALTDRAPDFKKVLLEELYIRMNFIVGEHVLRNLNVREIANEWVDRFTYEVGTKVLGQKYKQKYQVFVEVPKNWFQQFKAEVFPKSWKKKWPIQTRKIERAIHFDHFILYPDMRHIPMQREVYYSIPDHTYPSDVTIYKEEYEKDENK